MIAVHRPEETAGVSRIIKARRANVSYVYEQIQNTPEIRFWLSTASKLAVPVIAFAGAIYTALQFRRAKRWRAGDLAAKLSSDLTTDDELALACQAIDWAVGPLVVPLRYRAIMMGIPKDVKHPTPLELGEIAEHDTRIMALALEVRLSTIYLEYPLYLVYRYCFDKLFSHLSNINRLVESGQIVVKDLAAFSYWLRRLAEYEYPPDGVTGLQMFQRFLSYSGFGYSGVIELGKKLKVTGWSAGRVEDVTGYEAKLRKDLQG
jgi:hypothetical protein